MIQKKNECFLLFYRDMHAAYGECTFELWFWVCFDDSKTSIKTLMLINNLTSVRNSFIILFRDDVARKWCKLSTF